MHTSRQTKNDNPICILQYDNNTDMIEICVNRYTDAGVDLSALTAGIVTSINGIIDKISQIEGNNKLTTEFDDSSLIVKWIVGINTTVEIGEVLFFLTFNDGEEKVWQDGPYLLRIDPSIDQNEIVIEYASFLAQWEDRMNKTNKQALQSVESAKTQADRAENEADRAERAREDVTAAKTEVAAMREAVVADKAAVEAAQKDVAGRQAEISTAHEDIKLKTTAVLQAAEQVSNDKQAVDRAVAAFDETAANAVETIDDKAAAARQDVDDAASNATGTINSAAAAAETRINKAASDSAESIARQAQAVESAVSAAKTDITGMVSNAQAAESAAAQSAAQAAQSAQEAQAAADSVGDVSVLKTAMTGTGGVTLEYTADRPLKSLTISGVDVGNVNVWLCGKNIFDKSRAKNGYYVDANGNEVAGANWCVATIPLPPNRSVAITASYQGGAPRYCFFDSGGTLLLATQSKTLTTPDGTAYAKISISKNELDTFLVEFSSAQTEYTPYTGVEVVVDPQDIDTSKMRCYRGTTNIMAYTTDWQQLTVTAEAIQDLNLVIQEIKQAIIAGGAI